jgi:hypothetical protein
VACGPGRFLFFFFCFPGLPLSVFPSNIQDCIFILITTSVEFPAFGVELQLICFPLYFCLSVLDFYGRGNRSLSTAADVRIRGWRWCGTAGTPPTPDRRQRNGLGGPRGQPRRWRLRGVGDVMKEVPEERTATVRACFATASGCFAPPPYRTRVSCLQVHGTVHSLHSVPLALHWT